MAQIACGLWWVVFKIKPACVLSLLTLPVLTAVSFLSVESFVIAGQVNRQSCFGFSAELKGKRNFISSSNLSNMTNYTCIYTYVNFISLFLQSDLVNRLFINAQPLTNPEQGARARGESKPVHQHVLISKAIIWDYFSCGNGSVLVQYWCNLLCFCMCVI